jgi:cystathionine beta-lyase family protein involved in aluminum resistance
VTEYERLTLALLDQINSGIHAVTTALLNINLRDQDILLSTAKLHTERSKDVLNLAQTVTEAIKRDNQPSE